MVHAGTCAYLPGRRFGKDSCACIKTGDSCQFVYARFLYGVEKEREKEDKNENKTRKTNKEVNEKKKINRQ